MIRVPAGVERNIRIVMVGINKKEYICCYKKTLNLEIF